MLKAASQISKNAKMSSYEQTFLFDESRTVTVIDGDIPLNIEIGMNSSVLIKSHQQSYLTHGLHKFPAKFFPELPRWAIRKYSSEYATICDPMCGSGTVNVESLLERRNSIALDIDPFARFLTKVKTTPINSDSLDRVYSWLNRKLGNEVSSDKTSMPDFPLRDELWFNPKVSQELGKILYWIDEINQRFSDMTINEKQDITDFFRVCFSAIIRQVSNADNGCTRTVVRTRLNKHIKPSDVLTAFKKVTERNVPNMKEFDVICPRDVKVDILNNEREARHTLLPSESIDLAITSPPYINAVDYPRAHQLEMYWLGIINKEEHPVLSRMKKEYIGTESVPSKDYSKLHSYGLKELDNYLEVLFEVDQRRAFIAYKYFVDMEENLREMKRVLKSGSRYCVAVGNNTIRGRMIPTHRFLMQIATERVGFEIENVFISQVIRHFIKIRRKERINDDWILTLRKP